jgi:hypothetical protein
VIAVGLPASEFTFSSRGDFYERIRNDKPTNANQAI